MDSSNNSVMRHVDGGLKNSLNASHVIVAVQALLHASPMVNFLIQDGIHKKKCRSLLNCMLCSLSRVYDGMAETGIGDPTSLVMRWNGISSRMSNEMKVNPKEVLFDFINVMNMELVRRNSKFSISELLSSPLSKMWKSGLQMHVSCMQCGEFEKTSYESFISVTEIVSNLQKSILSYFWTGRQETCSQCSKGPAQVTCLDVSLAECVIVHTKRCTDKLPFELPLNLQVMSNKLILKSIIVQPSGKPCVFISICPDGHYRKFTDSKISTISPATLCMTDWIWQSELIFFFERVGENEMLHEAKGQQTLDIKNKRSNEGIKIKIRSSPEDFETDPLLDIQTFGKVITPNIESVKTQTEHSTANVAVQTAPLLCFEVCKDHKKFRFFTGLCKEDFCALYNLIGGHEVISRLKMNYGLTTPKKLRPSKLSSEDRLFMFLLRLRRGLPLEELAYIFDVSVSLAGDICYVMTRLIYLTFKEMEKDMFVTAAQQRKFKPKKMQPFKNLRVLLDGVSFGIQTPSNFEQQGNTFSLYKSLNVLVFSVGIACNGATIFCSDGMEGCMSDKEVILKSGLLDWLSKGDAVMTDRGYELTAELQAIGCDFYKPPSLGNRDAFTAEEEILTKAIASARIYTEHAMADIKDNRLLQGVIPQTLLPVISNLVYIAAYLRNFDACRIHDKKFVVEPK